MAVHNNPTPPGIDNDKCLLSIIVPMYNVEKYVRSCIESIYRQNLSEDIFEVIVVNDGTEDRSMEVIEDIINEHDNISVIHQENLSLSVARNKGMTVAKGEYILMPDSDDLLIENSLPILLDLATKSKADLVVADFLEMTDEEIDKLTPIIQPSLTIKEKKGDALFLEDLNPNECYVWHTLYRRSFLEDYRISFVPGITCQDIPFTHECYLRSEKSFKVNILLNIYRKRQMSATSNFNKKKCLDLCSAVSATWKLRNIKGLSKDAKKRLSDNIFVSFSLIFYVLQRGKCSRSERDEVFSRLNTLAPDLRFSRGIRQRITMFLYKLSPELYFDCRRFLKALKSAIN